MNCSFLTLVFLWISILVGYRWMTVFGILMQYIKKNRDPRWEEEFQFTLEEPPTNDRIHVEVVSTSSRMGLLHPKVQLHLFFNLINTYYFNSVVSIHPEGLCTTETVIKPISYNIQNGLIYYLSYHRFRLFQYLGNVLIFLIIILMMTQIRNGSKNWVLQAHTAAYLHKLLLIHICSN